MLSNVKRPESEPAVRAGVAVQFLEASWYAAHTCSRHEKRIAEQLSKKEIELFLPLYRSVHRWKDRQTQVELPLFPGYLFVRIALKDRLQVLQAPGLVRLVGFNGLPTPVPEAEIQALRKGMESAVNVEPHPYLNLGRRARIKNGPLQGIEGILVRKKSVFRLVLSVDLIMRSVAVEVDASDVELIR